MNIILVALGFIILGGVMYYVSIILDNLNKKDKQKEVLKMPYILRGSIFNSSEEAFYKELKKQVGDRYEIFTKIRIIDFIEVPKGSKNYSKWRNKIWAKHVDFLLCDSNFKPIVVLELDGKSHLNKVARDLFVSNVYKKVGIQFERVEVSENFSNKIKNILF